MIPRLGYPPANRHSLAPTSVNNFGEAAKPKGLKAFYDASRPPQWLLDLEKLSRASAAKTLPQGSAAGEPWDTDAAWQGVLANYRAAAARGKHIPPHPTPTFQERDFEERREIAELEEEEADQWHDPRFFLRDKISGRDRDHTHVCRYLPPPLVPYLDRMDAVRRAERERAILKYLGGWERLELVGLLPSELEERAEAKAAAYAVQFPAADPSGNLVNQLPEHRKKRMSKTWKRQMTKDARKARAYIAAAVGAVGGPASDERPLYVSDYGVSCHRAEVRQSREHMERLVILKKADPSVQISMVKAHEAKKQREMAKRRLLIDVTQARAETINARAIWITITLPGQFHPNPTNAGKEAVKWKPELGPAEAMAEMQKMYHQTMALLRERGSRPWGFWDAQAQQDGTPHRHILVFVHDRKIAEEECLMLLDPAAPESAKVAIREESEKRVLAEARGVVDAFRDRFPGKHGCDASVIGDDNADYRPRKGRDGSEETAASIAKYASRYATRLATGMGEDLEAKGDVMDDNAPITDLERHAVWASERRARLHNWIGQDSQRAPGRVWDCIWKAAERGECPLDRRMNLAIQHMLHAQSEIDMLVDLQERREAAQQHGEAEREKNLEELIAETQKEISQAAYHAALAAGIWADKDLHATERLWMHGALRLRISDLMPLPPMPLREQRENVYGEPIKETVGITSAIVIDEGDPTFILGMTLNESAQVKAYREAAAHKAAADDYKLLLPTTGNGWLLVQLSDDTRKQVRLKDEEWEIVDKETARERVERMEEEKAQAWAESIDRAEQEEFLRTMEEREESAQIEGTVPAQSTQCTASVSRPDDSQCTSSDSIAQMAFTGPLSDIAIDPRLGPDGPSRGDDGGGGEPPGASETQPPHQIVDEKRLERIRLRKGFAR